MHEQLGPGTQLRHATGIIFGIDIEFEFEFKVEVVVIFDHDSQLQRHK